MTSIGSKIREETTSLSEKKKINFYETNLVPYLYWVFWSLTWGNEWADDAYVGLNSFYGWTISRKLLKDVCWLKKQLVGCKRLLSRRNKSDRQTETWQTNRQTDGTSQTGKQKRDKDRKLIAFAVSHPKNCTNTKTAKCAKTT